MKKSSPTVSGHAKALRLLEIPIDRLSANPHNPRMLFDKTDMNPLKDSISKVGILVPITVYRKGDTENFVILDGQRRWMCAREIRLRTVPANEVSEPSLVQNIVTMFQIHKLRKDWELMPTALKVELLANEVPERNATRLATLTGLDEAVIVRCKKLLSFSRKYQDMMLDFEPTRRRKADFFIELYAVINDKTVKSFSWFQRDKFINSMIQKHDKQVLKSVTEFRKVKQHIRLAVDAKRTQLLSKRMKQFTEDVDIAVDFLEIESAAVSGLSKKIRKSASGLRKMLLEMEVDSFVGETEMWKSIEELLTTIRMVRKKLGERDDQ